jgi:hypothetical protein
MRKRNDQRSTTTIHAGLFATLLLLGHASFAAEPQVSADGWRPKRQPTAPRNPAEVEVATVPQPQQPAFTNQQTAVEKQQHESFDWRDDLYGPAPVTAHAIPATTAPGKTQVSSCWCTCETSAICGHCGLTRPIVAAYCDPPKSIASPRSMLVEDEQQLPVADRLRVALKQVNDRIQATLGQF